MSSASLPITATILVKGAPPLLAETLATLQDFDEVLIYDNGAAVETLEICRPFPNVSIVKGNFQGFGPTHNQASLSARHDWILSIDSDETASPELVDEIKKLILDTSSVYTIPRHNIFNGKWIRWCGWHPDRVRRLYNRSHTCFTSALVHESIEVKHCTEIKLKAPIYHYSYLTLADFLPKMQAYSDLFAEEHAGKKKSSPLKAFWHGLGAFLKSYIIKKGFLGGPEGFFISSYNAQTAFYKYLKLHEANCLKMRLCPEEKAKPSSTLFDAQK